MLVWALQVLFLINVPLIIKYVKCTENDTNDSKNSDGDILYDNTIPFTMEINKNKSMWLSEGLQMHFSESTVNGITDRCELVQIIELDEKGSYKIGTVDLIGIYLKVQSKCKYILKSDESKGQDNPESKLTEDKPENIESDKWIKFKRIADEDINNNFNLITYMNNKNTPYYITKKFFKDKVKNLVVTIAKSNKLTIAASFNDNMDDSIICKSKNPKVLIFNDYKICIIDNNEGEPIITEKYYNPETPITTTTTTSTNESENSGEQTSSEENQNETKGFKEIYSYRNSKKKCMFGDECLYPVLYEDIISNGTQNDYILYQDENDQLIGYQVCEESSTKKKIEFENGQNGRFLAGPVSITVKNDPSKNETYYLYEKYIDVENIDIDKDSVITDPNSTTSIISEWSIVTISNIETVSEEIIKKKINIKAGLFINPLINEEIAKIYDKNYTCSVPIFSVSQESEIEKSANFYVMWICEEKNKLGFGVFNMGTDTDNGDPKLITIKIQMTNEENFVISDPVITEIIVPKEKRDSIFEELKKEDIKKGNMKLVSFNHRISEQVYKGKLLNILCDIGIIYEEDNKNRYYISQSTLTYDIDRLFDNFPSIFDTELINLPYVYSNETKTEKMDYFNNIVNTQTQFSELTGYINLNSLFGARYNKIVSVEKETGSDMHALSVIVEDSENNNELKCLIVTINGFYDEFKGNNLINNVRAVSLTKIFNNVEKEKECHKNFLIYTNSNLTKKSESETGNSKSRYTISSDFHYTKKEETTENTIYSDFFIIMDSNGNLKSYITTLDYNRFMLKINGNEFDNFLKYNYEIRPDNSGILRIIKETEYEKYKIPELSLLNDSEEKKQYIAPLYKYPPKDSSIYTLITINNVINIEKINGDSVTNIPIQISDDKTLNSIKNVPTICIVTADPIENEKNILYTISIEKSTENVITNTISSVYQFIIRKFPPINNPLDSNNLINIQSEKIEIRQKKIFEINNLDIDFTIKHMTINAIILKDIDSKKYQIFSTGQLINQTFSETEISVPENSITEETRDKMNSCWGIEIKEEVKVNFKSYFAFELKEDNKTIVPYLIISLDSGKSNCIDSTYPDYIKVTITMKNESNDSTETKEMNYTSNDFNFVNIGAKSSVNVEDYTECIGGCKAIKLLLDNQFKNDVENVIGSSTNYSYTLDIKTSLILETVNKEYLIKDINLINGQKINYQTDEVTFIAKTYKTKLENMEEKTSKTDNEISQLNQTILGLSIKATENIAIYGSLGGSVVLLIIVLLVLIVLFASQSKRLRKIQTDLLVHNFHFGDENNNLINSGIHINSTNLNTPATRMEDSSLFSNQINSVQLHSPVININKKSKIKQDNTRNNTVQFKIKNKPSKENPKILNIQEKTIQQPRGLFSVDIAGVNSSQINKANEQTSLKFSPYKANIPMQNNEKFTYNNVNTFPQSKSAFDAVTSRYTF